MKKGEATSMDYCDKFFNFREHVLDRILRIANILGKGFMQDVDNDPISSSGFVVLAMGLPYFEMLAQATRGERSYGRSKEFFRAGFYLVYPDTELAPSEINDIYTVYRNGLFHSYIPNDRCAISRELDQAFAKRNGILIANPARMIEDLIRHFELYCDRLNFCDDPLSAPFEAFFDSFSEDSQVSDIDVGIGTTPDPARQ